MLDKKTAALISLCNRAGLLKSGEVKCEKTLKKGEAKLVIISTDASDNTKKKFLNKASYYNVPAFFFGETQELGKITGAGFTSSIVVTDYNLSEKLIDAMLSAGASALARG